MQPIFFAYGEGQFASTAIGVFSGLLVVVILLVLLVVYAAKTYPANRR